MSYETTIEDVHALAAAYALGVLDPDEARTFEEHLGAGCEACAAELREFEQVVGALGCTAPQIDAPPSARETLLTHVSKNTSEQSSTLDQQDSSAKKMYSLRASEGQWHEVAEGMFVKPLFTDRKAGTTTTLVKLLPGAHVPHHHHDGVEQCLILEGDFHVGDEVFGPGDFQCALPGSMHESIYTSGGALVLIVAPAGYQMAG